MVRSSAGAYLLAALQLAQPESATLTGTVVDSSGDRLADVEVTVTCGDHVRTGRSDQDGRFLVADLIATDCLVVTNRPFFRTLATSVDLRLETDLELALDIALETEVVVTPSRGARETAFDVPEAVGLVTTVELETRPRQILPEMLRDETAVLLQQTTPAHGSPFIRGLSAQRILYLIDGVRFNTSSFRSGATQFLAWVSPTVVDRLEVLRGPASVQYGSDALGGTIHVLTARPALTSAGPRVTGRVEGVVGSSDNSRGIDATVSLHGETFGLRLGGGTRDVGERRVGRDRDSHSVLTRYLGVSSDQLYTRLPDTGFTQSGGHIAFTARAGASGLLSGLVLREEQTGVHRYHRMLGGDGLHRSKLEPQQLDFALLRYERGAVGLLDSVSATLSLNRQQDDRLEQQRPTSAVETEMSRTAAVGYDLQGAATLPAGPEIRFGAEVYDERITAGRLFTDPLTGIGTPTRPRIPDGTRYTSAGLFTQLSSGYFDDRLFLRAGARYGHFLFSLGSQPGLGVAAERVTVGATTFHAAAVVTLTPHVNLTASLGRGFRAANAFDLGAVGLGGGGFEIAAATARALDAEVGSDDGVGAIGTGVAVPTLGPESSYAVELGLKLQTDRMAASVRLFDNELVDLIQRRAAIFGSPVVGLVVGGHEIVRQDAAGRAYVAADPRPIVTRVNVQRARIWGLETDMSWTGRNWDGRAHFSMASGRELPTDEFLRRMPPPFGGVRVRWRQTASRVWLEGGATFALAQRRLSPGDLADARIGALRTRDTIAGFFGGGAVDLGLVADGVLVASGETLEQVQRRVLGDAVSAPLFSHTPGFVVVSASAGFRLTRVMNLALFADNLTDRSYRWHGSGVDAAGVSIQIRTSYEF